MMSHGSVLTEDSTAGLGGGRGPRNERHLYGGCRILMRAGCPEESDKTFRAQRIWRSEGLNRGTGVPVRVVGLLEPDG